MSDHKRLTEPVTVNGDTKSFREIYGASTESLKDRSMPLDIAFGRSTDLKFRREQWASHNLLGQTRLREIDAFIIGGEWREYPTAPVSGKYKMWITPEGDLIRYQETMTIAIPNTDPRMQPITQVVTSTWDVDIKVDAKTDKSLYVLP